MQLFLAFVVALTVTAALIPVLVHWAPTIGLTDAPGPRKVHSIPVPRVGGLAMAVGLLLPTLITVELTPSIRGLLLGLVVLLVFGLWDDRVTLGYRTKFAGQVLAAGLCMVVGNVHVGTLMIGSVIVLPQAVSLFITFVFLVGITNAVNLADGLDGLAGGLVLLCLCAIALFAAMSGNVTVVETALIEAGAVLGFLRFNTHPARIFMGDSGSQMLGFSVGALAPLATQGEASPLSAALPLLLLGLPIMDTLTVMLTRMRAGRSPFSADSNHLHHRLLALGFAHREAVLLIYLMQVGLVLLAYFLRFESDSEVVIAFGVFAGVVIGLLRRANQVGWRLKYLGESGGVRRYLNGFTPAARIPTLALGVMTTCLVLYATTVIASSRHVGADLGLMCLGMLIVLLLLTSWKAQRSLVWFERTAVLSRHCARVSATSQDSPDQRGGFRSRLFGRDRSRGHRPHRWRTLFSRRPRQAELFGRARAATASAFRGRTGVPRPKNDRAAGLSRSVVFSGRRYPSCHRRAVASWSARVSSGRRHRRSRARGGAPRPHSR